VIDLDCIKKYFLLFLIFCVWEVVPRLFHIKPILIPPFSRVAVTWFALLLSGDLLVHTVHTLFRAVSGFFIAAWVGVLLGILAGRSRRIGQFLEPVVSVTFPIPKVAFVPIFIFVLGFGHLSKILIVALECSFPIFIATYFGVKGTSKFMVWSAQIMGTGERDFLRKVILPNALPMIFTGLEISIHVSVIIVVVAEMIGATTGLGALLIKAKWEYETDMLMAVIATTAFLGLGLSQSLKLVKHRLLAWSPEASL
jgi:ABC-type nitrate/sulfonate/bicarbonate transport system permease component